jgi:membrane protein DedA with SNARE-associated domain
MTTFEIAMSCMMAAILLSIGASVVFVAGYCLGKHFGTRRLDRPMQQFVRNENAERRIEELLTNAEGELHSIASGHEPPKPEYPGTSPARY